MPDSLLGLQTSTPDMFSPLSLVPSLIKLLPYYKGAHIVLSLNTWHLDSRMLDPTCSGPSCSSAPLRIRDGLDTLVHVRKPSISTPYLDLQDTSWSGSWLLFLFYHAHTHGDPAALASLLFLKHLKSFLSQGLALLFLFPGVLFP